LKTYGGRALAGVSGERATNEEAYLFQKFVRTVLGSNNVDHWDHIAYHSPVAGLGITTGTGAMTNSISEALHADAFLIAGTDPFKEFPILGTRIGQAARRGAKLVVIDTIDTVISKEADVFLKINPGTANAAVNGILSVIVEEGLYDKEYTSERVEGFDELKTHLKKKSAEKAAEICGVEAEDIRKAARIYASAEKAPIYYSLRFTAQGPGSVTVMNIANLALICGKVGKEGSGINPLRSGANLQGICDMGVLPAHYTAYQRLTNKESVQRFSEAWEEALPIEPGISLLEPMTEWKGLFVMGEDIITRADDRIDEVVKLIDGLELLVVQDAFLTETAKLADVVLPSCTYAEKEGTVTNTERRVQRIRKAIPMHKGTKEDWKILSELLALFGKKAYASAEEVFEEIRTVTPSYAGINFERLDAEGSLQWPCPTEAHPGTPVLHTEGFGRGEKALVVSVE